MAKQFLDYEGLDYYDSLIKQFINNGLNDTLQSALEHFSGALIPRGVIKNISGATFIDLRSEALDYYKAKTGDVYFIGEDDLKLTYVDTTGAVVQDEEVDKGDAIVCIVSADIATNGSVVSAAQWATLQANWSVTPNNSARLEFGKSQTTIKLAEVGGETIQLQVAPSSTIASSLRDDLADLGVVAVQKGSARPAKNIATSINANSTGALVPTDKAVYDFVSKHTHNAVTKIDWAKEENGTLAEPLSIDITGGSDEGWLAVPSADNTHSGVMTPKMYQELKESVNTVTPLIDDDGSLTIENAFNNGETFSFPVPLASEYNDGAMSKEDKETLDEVAKEIDEKADYKGMYVETRDNPAGLKICTLTLPKSSWFDLTVCFTMLGRFKRQTDVRICIATGADGMLYPIGCVLYTMNVYGSGHEVKAYISYTEENMVCDVWAQIPANEFLYVAKKTVGGRDIIVNNEDSVEWGMNLAPEMPSEEGYDYILNPVTPEWKGNASTASKLGTTTVGSTKIPVYLSNGTATPIGYSIEKSVPANAVFTDTHHTAKNVVSNTASTTANSATNSNVHLNLVENGSVRSSVRLTGTGGTKVTATGSGVVTIDSPNYGIATETTNGLITSSMAKNLAELDSTYPRLHGGTQVPSGADLNDSVYLEIGTYYCIDNATAKTLLNSPTQQAFIMWVNSGLGQNYILSGSNVYRVRIIQTYTGKYYIQQINGNYGTFTFGTWRRITDEEDIKGLVKDVNVRHDASGNVLVETEDYDGDFSSVSIPVATNVAAGVMSADMYNMLLTSSNKTYEVGPLYLGTGEKDVLIKLCPTNKDTQVVLEIVENNFSEDNAPQLHILRLYNYHSSGIITNAVANTTWSKEDLCAFHKDGYMYVYIGNRNQYEMFAIRMHSNLDGLSPTVTISPMPTDGVTNITEFSVLNTEYSKEERNKVSGLISGSVPAGNASLLEGIGASGFTRNFQGMYAEATIPYYIKLAQLKETSGARFESVHIVGCLGTFWGGERLTVCLTANTRSPKKISGWCYSPSTNGRAYMDIVLNEQYELLLVCKKQYCGWNLNVSIQDGDFDYIEGYVPTDTTFTTMSESNEIVNAILRQFGSSLVASVENAVKAQQDKNGADITTTYLTKAQVNTAASSSLGVKVAFSGTMGNLLPNVTVTSGTVANSANNVVTGHAVHTALSGNTYFSRISNEDIDNLFA